MNISTHLHFTPPQCVNQSTSTIVLYFCTPTQAVQLESVSPVRVRYLLIISTLNNKNETLLLGMDLPNMERYIKLL